MILFPYCLQPWLRNRDVGISRTRAEVEVTSHGLPEEARPFADRPVCGTTAALQLDDACPADLSLRYSVLLFPAPPPVPYSFSKV